MNLLTSLITLLAWIFWACTVLFVDPDIAVAPMLFYGTLFVALTCTLSRLMSGGDADGAGQSVVSFSANLGNSAVVSTLLLFALWLQSLGMLTPLNGGLLAVSFFLVEVGFYFSGADRRAKRRHRLKSIPTPDTSTRLASER
ncbi:MAG TPA: hypothetical protein VHS28_10390 [Chloroflexota bacterium]|nr:hypothetical protein [Chloroflexota bacterium]